MLLLIQKGRKDHYSSKIKSYLTAVADPFLRLVGTTAGSTSSSSAQNHIHNHHLNEHY